MTRFHFFAPTMIRGLFILFFLVGFQITGLCDALSPHATFGETPSITKREIRSFVLKFADALEVMDSVSLLSMCTDEAYVFFKDETDNFTNHDVAKKYADVFRMKRYKIDLLRIGEKIRKIGVSYGNYRETRGYKYGTLTLKIIENKLVVSNYRFRGY